LTGRTSPTLRWRCVTATLQEVGLASQPESGPAARQRITDPFPVGGRRPAALFALCNQCKAASGESRQVIVPGHWALAIPKGASMPERTTCTILIVDDEELNRDAVRRILERAGFAVCEAATGTEGLRLLSAVRPDLVIL